MQPRDLQFDSHGYQVNASWQVSLSEIAGHRNSGNARLLRIADGSGELRAVLKSQWVTLDPANVVGKGIAALKLGIIAAVAVRAVSQFGALHQRKNGSWGKRKISPMTPAIRSIFGPLLIHAAPKDLPGIDFGNFSFQLGLASVGATMNLRCRKTVSGGIR